MKIHCASEAEARILHALGHTCTYIVKGVLVTLCPARKARGAGVTRMRVRATDPDRTHARKPQGGRVAKGWHGGSNGRVNVGNTSSQKVTK